MKSTLSSPQTPADENDFGPGFIPPKLMESITMNSSKRCTHADTTLPQTSELLTLRNVSYLYNPKDTEFVNYR